MLFLRRRCPIVSAWRWPSRRQASRVSADGTHHVEDATGKPLYHERFSWVLPFHEPGFAPVGISGGGAWHIRLDGSAAYTQRYDRTFGFYGPKLAAVVAGQAWFHISPCGQRAYTDEWAWVGNFQGGRCAVRRADGGYAHIDAEGTLRTGGPHAYAGDFREGLAVVRSAFDGLCRHVDAEGRAPLGAPPSRGWLDLDVFHKGFARARDERGWHFVRRADWGDASTGVRYSALEPFYNGQALATRLDGNRCVVTEDGRTALELLPARGEDDGALQSLVTGYWPALAVRTGLREGLPALAAGDGGLSVPNDSRTAVLAAAWAELGLLKAQVEDAMAMRYALTPRGMALLPGTAARARAEYWLQDRYLAAWLPGFQQSSPTFTPAAVPRDTFVTLAAQPSALSLSRSVLESYAEDSWAGVEAIFAPLLTAAAATAGGGGGGPVVVVDVGGGSGALLRRLRSLASQALPLRLVCVDRPEVTSLNLQQQAQEGAAARTAGIEFVAADAFADPLPAHAHVYVLSRVLHDWDDARAGALLSAVRRAAAPSSHLVVLDRISTAAHTHALLSLHMHLLNGGRERRAEEWGALFRRAGWRDLAAAGDAPAVHAGHAVMVLRLASTSHSAAPGTGSPYSGAAPQPPSPTSGAATSSTPCNSGVLLVNHGYPPLFNAGSEIDTQTTALGLRRRGGPAFRDVAVFSREMDPFASDFGVRRVADALDASIPLFLVNNPREAAYSRYACSEIDDAFRRVMAERRPAVVHFGHVNHLSSSLPRIAKREFGAAVVFTLHDFFLLCPRGQFLVVGPVPAGSTQDAVYERCGGQDDAKCARRCFARRFGGGEGGEEDVGYWTGWVAKRMAAFRAMGAEDVDAFTAPSRQLLERFAGAEGRIPRAKLHFLPYGFDHTRLAGRARARTPDEPYTYAYTGRHEHSKGIHLLVGAAMRLAAASTAASAPFRVVIYGRDNGAATSSLRRMVEAGRSALPPGAPAWARAPGSLVSFAPEYCNQDIVADVFNRVDCVVVPSIWNENAPLVIHEALQARVPVITADVGGMAELVTDGVNGTLFVHRDERSLADAMQRVLDDPAAAGAMAARGYLADPTGLGNVPNADGQTDALVALYRRVCEKSLRVED